MCRSLEDMCNQAAQREQYKSAQRMLATGKLTYEEVANCSGLTVAEVEALAEKQSA